MKRRIKRRVLSMIPSLTLTARGNPIHWRIEYECGHADWFRAHYGHFPGLAGIVSRGYKVLMCCQQCAEEEGKK